VSCNSQQPGSIQPVITDINLAYYQDHHSSLGGVQKQHQQTGGRVNLERALRFSDRLDGHLVTGHIDGTGIIRDKKRIGNAEIFTIGVNDELSLYIVPKGSVAVDGISLTVNRCSRDFFEVSIIPHTAEITAIGFRRLGDNVNIETDIIGKYVNRFLAGAKTGYDNQADAGTITRESLLKAGFD